MALASKSELRIIPSGGPLGAEVRCVDVSRPVDDATFQMIYDAWTEHLVLVFRDQRLTDRQLIDFSRRFGELHAVVSQGSFPHETEVLTLLHGLVASGQVCVRNLEGWQDMAIALGQSLRRPGGVT